MCIIEKQPATDTPATITTPQTEESEKAKEIPDCQQCVTLAQQIEEQAEQINRLIVEQQSWEQEQQPQEKSEQFWMVNLAFLEQKWKWLRENISTKRPPMSDERNDRSEHSEHVKDEELPTPDEYPIKMENESDHELD